MDYLVMKFVDIDAGTHMASANNAIDLAQKDVVAVLIKHKAAPK